MPRFLFCGDPHGNFQRAINDIIEHRPDVTILLGDITPRHPLHLEFEAVRALTDIWWIPGNHDTDNEETYDNLFEPELSELSERNLHGDVVTICGVRVAGLGGVFREKVWSGRGPAVIRSPKEFVAKAGKGNLFRDGLPLRHRSTIFPSDIERLSGQTADILVTHEGPHHCFNGNQAITDLAEKMQVKAAFHGHHHQNIQYEGTVWRQVGLGDTFLLDFELPA